VADWLQWYYLIYLLPAGIALVLLVLSTLGGDSSEGDAEAADADLDAADLGEPGEAEADSADADEGSGSPGRWLMGFLGFGRVPMMMVLGSLALTWGLWGVAANGLLRPLLPSPAAFMGPSLALAAAGSLISTRGIVLLFGRLLPQDETSVISREALVGLTGKVIYPVTETGGRIHVRDQFRTLHTASARVQPGAPHISRGTTVIVASMGPEDRYVIVEPLGFEPERA
jgi:membrane protein implicated in regulation of membrane protease activity